MPECLATTLKSKSQVENELKQTLIQPMLKKIELVECVSERKRFDPPTGNDGKINWIGNISVKVIESDPKDSSQNLDKSELGTFLRHPITTYW